jgi:hypothetical protein
VSGRGSAASTCRFVCSSCWTGGHNNVLHNQHERLILLIQQAYMTWTPACTCLGSGLELTPCARHTDRFGSRHIASTPRHDTAYQLHLHCLHKQADEVYKRDEPGQAWRFCFQCGKLEHLEQFDGAQRCATLGSLSNSCCNGACTSQLAAGI